ncbi:MAG: hypothetical protein PHY95_01215 [Candidatus ainarchaeum sp.]|nr:hypothetical protein [Candidatus ainarchaeum sp.]
MFDVLAAVISGGSIKFVDFIEDEKKGKGLLKWPIALIAGLAFGYVLSFSPASSMFLAILAAQVFMGKVDRVAHGLAVIIAVITALFYGLGPMDLQLMVAFFILSTMDEVPLEGVLAPLGEYRLWLKGGTLCVGLITGAWSYFILIMAFDMAYLTVSYYLGEGIRPMRRK